MNSPCGVHLDPPTYKGRCILCEQLLAEIRSLPRGTVRLPSIHEVDGKLARVPGTGERQPHQKAWQSRGAATTRKIRDAAAGAWQSQGTKIRDAAEGF